MLSSTRRTSPAEVNRYQEEGYINFGPVLPPEDMAGIRAYVAELITCLHPQVRPENMNMPHLVDRYFIDLCSHPNLLDAVEPIIGPDIVLFACGLFCKPKGDGKEIPWHQDGIFWPLDPMKITTLWLAVDDSTIENGCMRVIPGTHKQGPIEHMGSGEGKALHLYLDSDKYDASKSVNVELKQGSCSFHDAFTVHGSNPNNSPNRRCGFTIRYMAADVKFDRSNWPDPNQPLFLLRGTDRLGCNEYADPESVPYRKPGEQFTPPF